MFFKVNKYNQNNNLWKNFENKLIHMEYVKNQIIFECTLYRFLISGRTAPEKIYLIKYNV